MDYRERFKTYQKKKDDKEYRTRVRIEFNLRHNVQFYRFRTFKWGQLQTRIKTRGGVDVDNVDRCVSDDNANANFWKRISVDTA